MLLAWVGGDFGYRGVEFGGGPVDLEGLLSVYLYWGFEWFFFFDSGIMILSFNLL